MASPDQVIQALSILYSASSDQQSSTQAQTWLYDVQESPQAWEISVQLLHKNVDQATSFFAAQTMRTKIKYYFFELPKDSYPELRQSLFNHISQFRDGPILTQLVLALVDLIIYYADWTGALNDCVDMFGQNPETLPCLLEIIQLLAEEISSKSPRVTDKRIYDMCAEIDSYGDSVLNFLSQCMSMPNLHKKAFTAYASWLRFGAFSNDSLLASPMLLAPFEAIKDDNLFEVCCNVIGATFYASNGREFTAVVNTVLPYAMGLNSNYREAVNSGDVGKQEGLASVFAELGEWYLDLIVASDDGYTAVSAILDVAKNEQYNIADMTFAFWFGLLRKLRKKDMDTYAGSLRDILENLVMELFRLMKLFDYTQLLEEDDDFMQFRYHAGDLLYKLAQLLGPKTTLKTLNSHFEIYFSPIKFNSGDIDWFGLEASIFAIASIGNCITSRETDIVPALCQNITNACEFSQTPITIKHSSLYLIGEFNKWLIDKPDYLGATFQLCCNTIATPALAAASAETICKLFIIDDKNAMLPYLDPFLEALTYAHNVIPKPDRLKLYSSSGVLFSTIKDPNELYNKLCKLIGPLVLDIDSLSQNQQPPNCRPLQDTYDCFSSIFEKLRLKSEPEKMACLKSIQSMWSSLLRALYCYQVNVEDVEKWTRCVKYIMRSVGVECSSFVGELVNIIVSVFKEHHHSSLLYLAACIVEVFGFQASNETWLLDLVKELRLSTFQVLNTPLEDTSVNVYVYHCELVEDYFHLLSRYITELGSKFIFHEIAAEGVNFAIEGLQGYNKHTFNTISQYLTHFLKFPSRARTDQYDQAVVAVDRVLQRSGQRLLFMIISCIGGSVSPAFLDDVCIILYELIGFSKVNRQSWAESVTVDVLNSWLVEIFQQISSNLLNDAAKNLFLSTIFNATDFDYLEQHVIDLSHSFVGKNQLIV